MRVISAKSNQAHGKHIKKFKSNYTLECSIRPLALWLTRPASQFGIELAVTYTAAPINYDGMIHVHKDLHLL